jgi:hypothetical protein
VFLGLVLGCSSPPTPITPAPIPIPDASPLDAPVALTAPDAAPPPLPWLKGTTHVHARPSGDSTTPIVDVIAYYEKHGYDFIALTDHNRVSEVSGDTTGKVAVHAPATGLIVLAGIELTFNPNVCLPQEPLTRCRIHVNALGVTERPVGKLEWADRQTEYRSAMYARGLAEATRLGGLAQLNHPQWQWGMQADLLIELARSGYKLFELANAQFPNWNSGDALHPSLESLWDAALVAGVELWGVASDDAHQYQEDGGGRYPAGGGWVMVRSVRDPGAIKAALAAGQFYASNGVTLARADAVHDELVIEVDPSSPGDHVISFIVNGAQSQAVNARSARAVIPATGYIRAVVTRTQDGARAWVQPARR